MIVSEFDNVLRRVYTERTLLIRALARALPPLSTNYGLTLDKARSDTDPWKYVFIIDLPTGQVSWHIHLNDLILLEDIPTYKGVWDGHTDDEKINRLRAF
jgi:hypothetical protein